jgi:uncharacterized caspase-like protein
MAQGRNVFQTAAFSPDGKKIATISYDSLIHAPGFPRKNLEGTAIRIGIWETRSGRLIKEKNIPLGQIEFGYQAQFTPDGQKIIVSNAFATDTVKVWNVADNELLSVFVPPGPFRTIRVMGNKGLISYRDNPPIITDIANKKPLVDLKGGTLDVESAEFSPDGGKLLTVTTDNTIRFWNANTDSLLYGFIAIDSADYLITDGYGRYDGSEAARKLLYFTCGTDFISLDQAKDSLWIPDLAERVNKGEAIQAAKLADLNLCGITPEVEASSTTDSGYQFKITPRGGGLGEAVLSVNGSETKRFTTDDLVKKNDHYELTIRKAELGDFLQLGEENFVTLKAYSEGDKIASRGATITERAEDNIGVHPNLFAVMVGINEYKSKSLHLNYASTDAESLSHTLVTAARKLLNADGKEHVFAYNLNTGKDRTDYPSKLAIKRAFEDISKKSRANDILLIFFAGHGVVGGDKKQFYFLTADASDYSDGASAGISAAELSEWIKPQQIKAQKRILVFDACNSGQLINDLVKVGTAGQNFVVARNDDNSQITKQIDKLNERSGLFILAASASDQSAYELSRYNQGILTYSLLQSIKQHPEILESRKYLDVGTWFNSARNIVGELARENHARQEPQLMSSNDFFIGIVDQDVLSTISLSGGNPVISGSNFHNRDERIGGDDLGLGALVNEGLDNMAGKNKNNAYTYVANYNSPDAWSINGSYAIIGRDAVRVGVNIWRGRMNIIHFEESGSKAGLEDLAQRICRHAVDWINANKSPDRK